MRGIAALPGRVVAGVLAVFAVVGIAIGASLTANDENLSEVGDGPSTPHSTSSAPPVIPTTTTIVIPAPSGSSATRPTNPPVARPSTQPQRDAGQRPVPPAPSSEPGAPTPPKLIDPPVYTKCLKGEFKVPDCADDGVRNGSA
ncbi:hypothetical protein NLX83_21590 [Allokutzneria sp. A3M-2-11 16]|uniref:hypothetical protein n=1 Tax=Allokutzneria sp. A3M-2-11 16 TaxID=2962043 RepID=UPI0020B84CD0|nr:hypothetical protein [Allokutzneria sp. A3M-2-11 16]MCP3801863.1 hypothetical protein [Allokutzneria sp. A3M-2-11 16]